MKVYLSVSNFDGRSSLYAWIYRIAVNECYGFLRKKRRKLLHESDSADSSVSTRVQMTLDPHLTADGVIRQRDLLTSCWRVSRKRTATCCYCENSKVTL